MRVSLAEHGLARMFLPEGKHTFFLNVISAMFECSLISLHRIHSPSGPWPEWNTYELYGPNTTSSLQGGDPGH